MAGSGGYDTNQVSVTSAATLIVARRPGRVAVTIINKSTTEVDLGHDATVTTATGAPLIGAVGASITIPTQEAVYGISNGGTVTVGVIESY